MKKLNRVLRSISFVALACQVYAFWSRYNGELSLSLDVLNLYFLRLPLPADLTFGQALSSTASANAFVTCCVLVFLEVCQLPSQSHVAVKLLRGVAVAAVFAALSMVFTLGVVFPLLLERLVKHNVFGLREPPKAFIDVLRGLSAVMYSLLATLTTVAFYVPLFTRLEQKPLISILEEMTAPASVGPTADFLCVSLSLALFVAGDLTTKRELVKQLRKVVDSSKEVRTSSNQKRALETGFTVTTFEDAQAEDGTISVVQAQNVVLCLKDSNTLCWTAGAANEERQLVLKQICDVFCGKQSPTLKREACAAAVFDACVTVASKKLAMHAEFETSGHRGAFLLALREAIQGSGKLVREDTSRELVKRTKGGFPYSKLVCAFCFVVMALTGTSVFSAYLTYREVFLRSPIKATKSS